MDFWEMRDNFIPRIDQGSALTVGVVLRLLLSGSLRIETFHLLRNGKGIGCNRLPLGREELGLFTGDMVRKFSRRKWVWLTKRKKKSKRRRACVLGEEGVCD